jgi:hypothetical protein
MLRSLRFGRLQQLVGRRGLIMSLLALAAAGATYGMNRRRQLNGALGFIRRIIR